MRKNGIDLAVLEGFEQLLAAEPSAGAATVRVRNRWRGGYTMLAVADELSIGGEVLPRDHHIGADLPGEVGGTDRSAAPTELLLTALSACVAQQLVERASVRGLDVGRLELTCEGQIDLRGGAGHDGIRPGLSAVRIELDVVEGADPELEEQLDELVAAAVQASPIASSVMYEVPLHHGVSSTTPGAET